jgi:hypothetical protein
MCAIAGWQSKGKRRRRYVRARWLTVAQGRAIAGGRWITIRRWPVIRRRRTVLGVPKTGWWCIGVRWRSITPLWRTVFGMWAMSGWRPITVRRWHIAEYGRGHALGPSMIETCPRCEWHCREGDRNAKAAHDVPVRCSRPSSTFKPVGCSDDPCVRPGAAGADEGFVQRIFQSRHRGTACRWRGRVGDTGLGALSRRKRCSRASRARRDSKHDKRNLIELPPPKEKESQAIGSPKTP